MSEEKEEKEFEENMEKIEKDFPRKNMYFTIAMDYEDLDKKISELNLAFRNASFSQLLFSENRLNVLSLNETPHLSKELITFV